jgi:hypothetical protein
MPTHQLAEAQSGTGGDTDIFKRNTFQVSFHDCGSEYLSFYVYFVIHTFPLITITILSMHQIGSKSLPESQCLFSWQPFWQNIRPNFEVTLFLATRLPDWTTFPPLPIERERERERERDRERREKREQEIDREREREERERESHLPTTNSNSLKPFQNGSRDVGLL